MYNNYTVFALLEHVCIRSENATKYDLKQNKYITGLVHILCTKCKYYV